LCSFCGELSCDRTARSGEWQATAYDGDEYGRAAVSTQQQDPQRLQELQERIEALQKQLESLQREMEEVRLYIEEQAQETIPVIQTNLAEALRFRPGNYIQFQWFDSQENRTNEGLPTASVPHQPDECD
jgi:TolA-binding protein